MDEVKDMMECVELWRQKLEKPNPTRSYQQAIIDLINRGYKMHGEVAELIKSAESDNHEEILDAIGDILYLLLGMVHDIGLNPADLSVIFHEIHESNMSKSNDKGELEYKNGKMVKLDTFKPPKLDNIALHSFMLSGTYRLDSEKYHKCKRCEGIIRGVSKQNEEEMYAVLPNGEILSTIRSFDNQHDQRHYYWCPDCGNHSETFRGTRHPYKLMDVSRDEPTEMSNWSSRD